MAIATPTVTRTDEQIQRDVLAELKWDARVQPNEIGVAVKDGIVTLTGWVDSYPKRWAAEEAAKRVRGVKAVANDIEVRLPISAERTDADIAAAALRALEWDASIPSDRVKVTVSKGWVTASANGQGPTYLVQEVSREPMARVFTFPATIDVDNIEARLELGILRIRVPKAEGAPSRVIKVQG
jgi:hypothetical protein